MLDLTAPNSWPKRHLSPLDLGVPLQFICDGCTASPDWSWIHPACKLHDMLYFMGGPEYSRDEEFRLRALADDALLRVALHNARYDAFSPLGEARVSFWKHLKRVAAAYGMYYTAVRQTAKAVESFLVWPYGQLPFPPDSEFIEAARAAGKWKD